MRKILPVLLGLLLLVTLAGPSGPGIAPASGIVAVSRPDVPVADAACAEVTEHPACQPAAADRPPVTAPDAAPRALRFEIAAVADSSRTLAPHTPPPRDIS